MKKNLIKVMGNFYHDMAILELKLQNADFSKTELTYNSLQYLEIIGAHQGEYTASKIADILHVARPSVTQKINKLEELGYIEKKQSDIDKRIYYLYTTNKADKKKNEMLKIDAKIESALKEKYNQEDLDMFFGIIEFMGNLYKEEDIKIENE